MVQIHAPAPSDDPPRELLRPELARAVEREDPRAGDLWIVAFSGGPDSTALAAALAPLASARDLRLTAVHVDHGADPGSGARAAEAAALARRIGLAFRLETRDVPRARLRGESPEAAARRVRYEALAAARTELGATRLLTAHQRDDQVETVLLRLLSGSGLEGLAGIPARRGALLRPLLNVPRAEIDRFLASAGLVAVEDPTNRDPRFLRNRVRRLLLPRLRAEYPDLDDVVLALAGRAQQLRETLDSALRRGLGQASNEGGVSAAALLALPGELRPWALRFLLRQSGLVRLPSSLSMEAFLSSLGRSGRAQLLLPGDPRRLVASRGRIAVASPKSRTAPFSYTFELPGAIELEALGLRLSLLRSKAETWMLRGDAHRAGLALADPPGVATVRSRRPGDRIRPLGAPGERKLKDLLIDRGVPAETRDRLPLLVVGGRIAWVPGVAIDESFRLGEGPDCWVAELLPAGTGGNPAAPATVEGCERNPPS